MDLGDIELTLTPISGKSGKAYMGAKRERIEGNFEGDWHVCFGLGKSHRIACF